MGYTRWIMLLIAGAFACGGDDATDPGNDDGNGAGNFTVSVVNNDFSPNTLSVPVGSNVTWQWNSGGVTHNVTFEDGAAGSGNLTTGTFARSFSATGEYAYFCNIHLVEGMTGTVSVTAGTTGGTGNDGTGDGDGGGAYP